MRNIKVISSPKHRFSDNAVYYFKKTFNIKSKSRLILNISADARYKLYINDKFVGAGPCKGCHEERYYDQIDVSDKLIIGENVIYVVVLQLSLVEDVSKHCYLTSVFRTGALAFVLWGELNDGKNVTPIYTDKSWETSAETGINFIPPVYAVHAGLNEDIDGSKYRHFAWEKAIEISSLQCKDADEIEYGDINSWYVSKRPIPMLYLIEKKLVHLPDSLVVDAGELTTGYLRIKCKGKGRLRLTYGECFAFERDGEIHKENRTDERGIIIGDYDEIWVDGSLYYEPFWFRTFRYIKIDKEQGVEIEDITYVETGYPLIYINDFESSDKLDALLWKASLRTLQRCMHETYEDCPYYEQLQYGMDTFLQMLFTYQISNDDLLARKAMHDFAMSQQKDGLMQSRFPSVKKQFIPPFSLFFVLMVSEHYKRFNDIKLVKKYLSHIDGVLNWFYNELDFKGLVRKSKYWNFIDWAVEWDDTLGVPALDREEPITIVSMMYSFVLNEAGKLNNFAGRNDIADDYIKRSSMIKEAVKKECFCEKNKLYADGSNKKTFSQHTQIWAVLSDTEYEKEQRSLLERSFSLTPKVNLSYAFFLFRALEKAGIYEKSDLMINSLKELLKLNCTTIPETFTDSRSECHAWGAIVLYEFAVKVLGVSTIDAENKKILIKPFIKGRSLAKGSVCTIWGKVTVNWSIKKGNFKIRVISPKDTKKIVILPDGTRHISKDEVIDLFIKLDIIV